jgi:hypothetical protein
MQAAVKVESKLAFPGSYYCQAIRGAVHNEEQIVLTNGEHIYILIDMACSHTASEVAFHTNTLVSKAFQLLDEQPQNSSLFIIT